MGIIGKQLDPDGVLFDNAISLRPDEGGAISISVRVNTHRMDLLPLSLRREGRLKSRGSSQIALLLDSSLSCRSYRSVSISDFKWRTIVYYLYTQPVP